MKKNMIKILSVLLIVIAIVLISNQVFARELLGKVEADTDTTTAGTVGSVGGIVVGVLQVIGVSAAIIMLVFLGIKYVSAAPAEKADIKKGAVIYIVGAVLLLGATLILGWVADFVQDLEGTSNGSTSRIERLA